MIFNVIVKDSLMLKNVEISTFSENSHSAEKDSSHSAHTEKIRIQQKSNIQVILDSSKHAKFLPFSENPFMLNYVDDPLKIEKRKIFRIQWKLRGGGGCLMFCPICPMFYYRLSYF